jgi:hypothetical protein
VKGAAGAGGRPRVDVDALAARVRAWAAGDAVRKGARRLPVVALDGPSGAGKTRLALALAARVPGAAVVHLDDLYPGWDGLDAAVPLLAEQVLVPLAGTSPIAVPTWDWERDEPGARRTLTALGPPRPAVVLVEGAGAGARPVAPHLAGLIWVEAADDVRRRRALARDGDSYAPHWLRWARQETAHFRREGTRARADLVLDTSDGPDHPVVVREGSR